MREPMKPFKGTDFFVQTYSNCFIQRIEAHSMSGLCFLYFADGTVRFFETAFDFFNTQYGIPVSEKHHCIFIGTWRKGLCCYDAYTGERRWRSPMGRNRNMYIPPHSDYVITTRAGKGRFRLDISTGLAHDSLRSDNTEDSYGITDSVAFVDRLGRDYCLVDLEQFRIIKHYPCKVVELPGNDNFILMDAWIEHDDTLSEDKLFIEYWHRNPGEENSELRHRQIDSFPSLEALRNGD